MKRIVVGVDGSDGARRALQWAADEARAHGAVLVPVMAWSYLAQPGGTFRPDWDESHAREVLDAGVADALGDEPDVTLEPVVVCDLPVSALLGAAADADLLVVGARGLGGFSGLLLGSVSSQCLHHSPVPVVVVR